MLDDEDKILDGEVDIGEDYEMKLPESIAQILDPGNYSPITLYGPDNKPILFDQVANIRLADNMYVLLKPSKPMKGVPDDNCLCFEIVEYEDGISLEEVEDETAANKVFEEYLRLRDEK